MTQETWLVLGASSSISRAFALEVAARGCDLLLAGRDLEDLERNAADITVRHDVAANAVAFDATDFDTHEAFVTDCRAQIDGVMNVFLAFAMMPHQTDIDADFSLARRTIETTYLGAVSVLARLVPHLEAQGGGRVVVLGSVAGDRGRPKNYVYGSAKAGLHAYLQGLRARLFRAGVTVTTIKPGFVDTAMSFGHPGTFLVASPQRFAAAALRAALRGREVCYVPWFWRIIMTLIKAVPEPLFKRLDI